MKLIPSQVNYEPIPGLIRTSQGKVCDVYSGLIDPKTRRPRPDLALKHITNRVSGYDVILPFPVAKKGMYLNLIDHWWRQQMTWAQHDVVAVGSQIDQYLPTADLRGRVDLHESARVITREFALKVELVYRWLLTGTGKTLYGENAGVVCGQKLPPNLKEWDEINPSVSTPTEKSEEGHDDPMDIDDCRRRFGFGPIELTHPLFELGRCIAATKGIIIADTKFEVARNGRGELVLIDEVLTPDSSRFLPEAELGFARATPGYKPKSWDKQPVRNYLKDVLGVTPSTDLTPEIVAKVHNHVFPESIAVETTERYASLHTQLTGMTAEDHLALLN